MPIWLLSSTFYGQWLPGDSRGSVTNVRDRRPGDEKMPVRIEHSNPGQDYEDTIPVLERAARDQLKGPPVCLNLQQAEKLIEQFQETAEYRSWTLTPFQLCSITSIWSSTLPPNSARCNSYATSKVTGHGGSIIYLVVRPLALGGRIVAHAESFAIWLAPFSTCVTDSRHRWSYGTWSGVGYRQKNLIRITCFQETPSLSSEPPALTGREERDILPPLTREARNSVGALHTVAG